MSGRNWSMKIGKNKRQKEKTNGKQQEKKKQERIRNKNL